MPLETRVKQVKPRKEKAGEVLLRAYGFSLFLSWFCLAVFAVKFFNATRRIQKFLLTGKKGMAL